MAIVTKDPQPHSVRHYKTIVARRYNPAMMQVNICYLFISNKCTRSECVKLFDNKIVQTKCHSALPGRQWCPCRERYDLSVLCRHVAYWYADQSASCTLSSRSCSTSCSTVLAATVQRCGLGRRRRVDWANGRVLWCRRSRDLHAPYSVDLLLLCVVAASKRSSMPTYLPPPRRSTTVYWVRPRIDTLL